jgi:hypothetical protein
MLESRLLLLEAAQRQFAEFERRENEFRKKDRAERAAELRLPLEDQKRRQRM